MAKIILVTHQKGGVGKSTITFNVASNLRDKAKVCVVDMDSQGSLLSLRQTSEVEIFPAEDLEKVCKAGYQYIFIDTPPYLSDSLPMLCNMADVIIIPTKAGVLDLLAIRSTIHIVKETKSENKAFILFNMVKPNTSLTHEIKDQLDQYGVSVSNTMISDLVVFSRSVLEGNVEEHSKAQKQIDDLTQEILVKCTY